jgi:hypothetical protein
MPNLDQIIFQIITSAEPDGWGRRVTLRNHAKRREQIRADGRDLPPPNALDLHESRGRTSTQVRQPMGAC